MTIALVHFFLVISIQFIFFAIHTYSVGEGRQLFSYLKKGVILGLPFGVGLDLLFGHTLNLWDYTLGYTWWFLTINGLFSYGFMVANVFLLKHHSLIHMYLWSIGLAIVYEITNYVLPVWEWTFYDNNSLIEYAGVIFIGYAGLTALMMAAMRLSYTFHFRLLPF
jgi:hypothetical protein